MSAAVLVVVRAVLIHLQNTASSDLVLPVTHFESIILASSSGLADLMLFSRFQRFWS